MHNPSGMLALTLLLNMVLEVLARAIRQEKKNQGGTQQRASGQVTMFVDDVILHIKERKHSLRDYWNS